MAKEYALQRLSPESPGFDEESEQFIRVNLFIERTLPAIIKSLLKSRYEIRSTLIDAEHRHRHERTNEWMDD